MTRRARSPFLDVAGAAELLGWSRRSVHERTRTRSIPMRRIAGSRRCLFLESEILAWVDGAELTVSETADGGVVVRPVER
jgi:predicted DNA-binding transcriptional regulator AlpA